MPRVNAAAALRGGAKARRKPAMPDRLSAREAFQRRLRKSARPGLWVLGAFMGLLVLPALVRSAAHIPVVTYVADGAAGIAGAMGLRVAHIEIEGAVTTPAGLIQAALGIDDGAPILGISPRAAAARVAALGPVQTAVVERVLPDTVVVRVTERPPFAIWQQPDGKFAVLARDGSVIADQDAAAARKRNPALLLVSGKDAPAETAALEGELAAHVPVQTRVAAAARIDGLRWNLVLADKTVVKLPDRNEAAAIAALDGLQAKMQLLDRPVQTIDLREPGRMIVTPYPAPAPSKEPKKPASGGA